MANCLTSQTLGFRNGPINHHVDIRVSDSAELGIEMKHVPHKMCDILLNQSEEELQTVLPSSMPVAMWIWTILCFLFILVCVLFKYLPPLSSSMRRTTYRSLGSLADGLDTFWSNLSSNRRPVTDLFPSDVDSLSDEELIKLKKLAPRLRSGYAVYQITPKTVAKVSQDMDQDISDATEANALRLVFEKTTIPVPRVRRVVKREWDYLIVMDHIEGPTLDRVWSTLPLKRKIGIALTLRSYIRQLRRLEAPLHTPPGPLSEKGPRICESPIFGQVQPHRGPFASYKELTVFFKERCQMGLDAMKVPADHSRRKEQFDDSEPLVFTHQDINPRNIILGEDGRLWLVDWAWAGYYPPWFEFVAMRRQLKNEEILGFDHEFWGTFIPFICGPYFTQERWLDTMSMGLYFL